MKKRLISTLLALILGLVFTIPNTVFATSFQADTEANLLKAIEDAENGDVISLTDNIELTKPIEISKKTLIINGNGHYVTKSSSSWTNNGSNATLITSGIEANITLSNITLKGSEKYGAQVYNGGYLALDRVSASDNKFGGILVNAGTLEVISLYLGHNGNEGSNNGIEIAKGREISDEYDSNQPKVIMNGVLTSSQTQNVVYLASNDNLTQFSVENTPNTKDHILLNENKVVVTDENNEVKFISNENDNVQLKGENFAKNITITVQLNDKTTIVIVQENTILTKELLLSKIDLSALGLNNYIIEGFYTDPELKTEINYTDPISVDATLYAKLSLNNQKDETYKTGSINITIISSIVAILSLVGISIIIKANKKIFE